MDYYQVRQFDVSLAVMVVDFAGLAACTHSLWCHRYPL